MSLVFAASLGLAACDENGEFAFPTGNQSAATSTSAAAPRQTSTTEQDVERPDLFEVTDRGLWDGRPSLGGAWVAHPDVVDPERALIRNTATGETIVGALFRRERENPGPLLQVSSDVADALGILPGAPTELYVVALRREEIIVEGEELPEDNPVVASLATPINVEATPLDPIAGAAAAIDAAEETVAPAIDVVLPAAAVTATATIPDQAPQTDASAEVAAAPAAAPLEGPMIQIGVFSVEANANQSAQRLRDAGIPTSVIAQEAGGRTVWRVASGSSDDAADRDGILAKIKELGYADAFVVDG